MLLAAFVAVIAGSLRESAETDKEDALNEEDKDVDIETETGRVAVMGVHTVHLSSEGNEEGREDGDLLL